MRPPPRPIGKSRKALWQQWLHDSLIEQMACVGPGVITCSTTHGVTQRMMQRSGAEGETTLPELPNLDDRFYWFGYWYDDAGALNYWNTSPVTHSGRTWARFTNPFTAHEFVQGELVADFFFWGVASLLDDNGNAIDADAGASLGVVQGPRPYPVRPGQNSAFNFRLAIGQYVDLEVIEMNPTWRGWFWGALAVRLAPPPDVPYIETHEGYRFYPEGTVTTPLEPPQPLPYPD